MSYLTEKQLRAMNFGFLGKDVKISDKAVFYEPHLQKIGNSSRIDDFVILSGKIEIGRNVHLAVQCNLAGGSEGIFIGDFSGLAYACQVFSQSDDYSGATLTNPTIPDKFKNETKSSVVISRHCILGTNTVVFPGVKVGEGCSFAAKSLVIRNTEPWGMYAGTPVRRISDRQKDLLKLENIFLDEFG
jgi:acetyltransferase-like isoleucine patch superfamily enzyme